MANLLSYMQAQLKQHKYLLEVVMWLAGIALLGLMDPEGEHLFSLCPFSWLLEGGCWGCGLGHGIAYLFRGEWQEAWNAHPLAFPALVLLSWRCTQLLRWHFKQIKYLTLNKENG